MRVLVAEDDPRLADLLAESLADVGWQVTVVHDGSSAFDLLLEDEDAVDVVVLDWMLPGMDGSGVVQRLRRRGIDTPVLVLTAHSGALDRSDALSAGADDYLAKPFNLDVLLDHLHALGHRGDVEAP